MVELRVIELDELEILLSLLSQTEDLKDLTCDQISTKLSQKYQVKCSGEEVFLLHEPDVQDVWYEDSYYYKNVLGLC